MDGKHRMPVVHLFGQADWHDDALIAMNEAGRHALIAALQARVPLVEVMPDDGEFYSLRLVIVPDEQTKDLPAPYTDATCGARERDQVKVRRMWERAYEAALEYDADHSKQSYETTRALMDAYPLPEDAPE